MKIFDLTEIYTGNIFYIAEFFTGWLAECSIRVPFLLEYLDLTLYARSWVSVHNSLAFTQILLYYCKEFL